MNSVLPKSESIFETWTVASIEGSSMLSLVHISAWTFLFNVLLILSQSSTSNFSRMTPWIASSTSPTVITLSSSDFGMRIRTSQGNESHTIRMSRTAGRVAGRVKIASGIGSDMPRDVIHRASRWLSVMSQATLCWRRPSSASCRWSACNGGLRGPDLRILKGQTVRNCFSCSCIIVLTFLACRRLGEHRRCILFGRTSRKLPIPRAEIVRCMPMAFRALEHARLPHGFHDIRIIGGNHSPDGME